MWKKLASKVILSHPRLTVYEDTVELPTGQQVTYVKTGMDGRAAMVICVRDGKVLLQQEYSYPPNEVLYQFPGGGARADEDPEAAARRELQEEAGLLAESLVPLGWFYLDNRRSNAKLHVFFAPEVSVADKAGGDIEEDISSHWFTVPELEQLIRGGKINNPTALAGWALFKAHQTGEKTVEFT